MEGRVLTEGSVLTEEEMEEFGMVYSQEFGKHKIYKSGDLSFLMSPLDGGKMEIYLMHKSGKLLYMIDEHGEPREFPSGSRI